VWCRPHFAVGRNSPAKTKPETKEHSMLKNFVIKLIIDGKIKLTYSTIKRHGEKNEKNINLEIKDIVDIIDWINLDTEVRTKGSGTVIGDVLLPFKTEHPILGHGINFEIQLTPQTTKITWDRTIKWALNGFSVVWIFGNDVDVDNNFNIKLKEKSLKIYPYKSQLKYAGKSFVKELKNTVIEQTRQLEEELKYVKNKSKIYIKLLKENNEKIEKELISDWDVHEIIKIKIDKRLKKIYDDIPKTELVENVGGSISLWMEENPDTVKDLLYSQIFNKIDNNIEIDKMISTINLDEIKKQSEKKIENIIKYNAFVSNPPKCPKCGSLCTFYPKGNYNNNPWWGCSGFKELGCKYTISLGDILWLKEVISGD